MDTEAVNRFNREQLRLYLVTDRELTGGRKLAALVRMAVEGGVTMVQLREKSLSTREFVEEGIEFKSLLSPLGIPLIINDRVDVALACNADGVHIGQSDMPYALARKLMGPDRIIGLSAENLEQVIQANSLDVDYIGISPVFPTSTKTDTAPAFGIEGLAAATSLSTHPCVGIGGIKADNVSKVIAAGADGVAVVSAIMSSEDPFRAASELLALTRKLI